MKLFGNSKKSNHRVASRKAAKTGKTSEDVRVTRKRGKLANSAIGKRWLKIPGIYRGLILLVAALLLLTGVCFGAYRALVRPVERPNNGDNMPIKVTTVKEVDPETGEEIEVELEVPVGYRDGFYNILIAGTDDDGGRTDTIIIASLDTNTHTVAMMSIPRDTLISTSYSVPKINSAYGAGGKGKKGMENLKAQLKKITGFEVDGYVLVDLEAFVKIVDLVGGVEFDVPQNMYYNDPNQNLYINLSAGYQTLDGEHAMELVRYRKYAQADIQRISVQQDFLKALAKKCMQIGNLTKIREFAQIISEYVTTDLTVGNMVYFGQELLKCDFDNMKTYTPEGEGVMIRGGSYYSLYKSSLVEIINESFNPYDQKITEADITLGSKSGSSSTGTSSSGSHSSGSGSTNSTGSNHNSGSENNTATTPSTDPTPDPTPVNPVEPGEPSTDPEQPTEPGGTTTEPEPPTDPGTTEPSTPEPTEPGGSDSDSQWGGFVAEG